MAAFNVSWPPHVLYGNAALDAIVSVDMADQTDGAMHLILALPHYTRATGDDSLAAVWFPFVAALLDHYVAPGASMAPVGPAYFNASLGLLFNPNLEHSRDGVYWST
jgi:hypothetical protein